MMKATGNGFAGMNGVGDENDEVGEWKVEAWKECMNVEQSILVLRQVDEQ